MDSCNFHFERMSNVDLHPLSQPVSRLSPAKSNSSIVDQLAHHQHGKGDSAYSSFSGGSTAPDYPSTFLPDDLQSNSFSHYADLKYVKSIYHPTKDLQSESKTMDQLYRSVEAISQQYRNNTSTNLNYHNGSGSFHTNNNKAHSKKDMPLGAPSQGACPLVCPPPVPARLDSFIATKNLENSRVHQQDTEFQPQQPQPQQQPRTHNRLHPQSHGPNTPRTETANPDTVNPSFNSDQVYSVWRGSQQPQAQQPPTYRLHLQPHDQTRTLNPECLFIMDNKAASEQQKSPNILSRSPPRGTNQAEHLKPTQPSSSGACNGDYKNKTGERKREDSAHDWHGSEPNRPASPWNASQSFINSSIQHKGQFYFVTGVCKLSESGKMTHSAVCGSEAGSESSTWSKEAHRLTEKERCHSTMDNLFRPHQESSCTSSGMIPDEREAFTPVSQGKDLSSRSQENRKPSLILTQSSQSFDSSEEINMMQSREIGRHTADNPIFYCGPDINCLPHSTTQTKEVESLLSNEQPNHTNREEKARRGKQQPLEDVDSKRINKETTPLLYHLTEVLLRNKRDANVNIKDKEAILNKTAHGDVAVDYNVRPPQDDTSKNDRGEVVSIACNTLDDSFTKYYKEKLKDAQSKVLRETSFKRRDLQLSWLYRIRQKSEQRLQVSHTVSSSQDSDTSTDTLTPSVTSEEIERGSNKEEVRENQKEMHKENEKENGRPANVAQPQAARIRGRKRLTPEQKKMCYSEPEKLNQLGVVPIHSAHRSFGNESDDVFDCEGDERVQRGELGLVATRRKMFETRSRTLSTPSTLKTNLKHLQHKALVEYMERKTGHKVAEPQQPVPLLPRPSRQRHSLGEKPFDWGPRPLSGNHESKNVKRKPHRPHSAGRILDSSSSSIRYAQFFSDQSCSGQYVEQSSQPRWRVSHGPSQGMSASVESLLEQPEPPSFFRNRSTSIPHVFEAPNSKKHPSPVNTMETQSPQKDATEDSSIKPAPQGQECVRMVAQRGMSMEELGESKLTRPTVLSRSSEQLDQLWRYSTQSGGPDRDKKSDKLFSVVREVQWQNKGRKKQHVTEQAGQEPEIVVQKITQGQTQNQTQKRSLLKQISEPEEDATVGTRNSSRSTSPASCSSSRARVPSESHSPVRDDDEFRSSRPPSETSSNPPSPRGLETSKREIKSTASTPTQINLPFENRPSSSKFSTSPSLSGSEKERSVDEPSNDAPPPDSKHEVSLSCGVTTDLSLWIIPPEDDIKEVQTSPLKDNDFDDESSSSALPTQASETPVSTRISVSDTDTSQQQVEEEKPPETEENQAMEERGTPEGETKSLDRPAERPQWEELVEAVVKADQSLARVLYPLANRKTALMLMEQLLSEDTLLMEEHYKKKQEQKEAAESAETVEGAEPSPCPYALDSLKPPSATTDMQNKTDIAEKKRLLVSYIEARLRSLEETRGTLQTEIEENVAHGEALKVLVRERCLPVELERYNLFIGDLERVVNLLLCLSARLARVQNALSTVDQHTDAEEKQSLDSRHRLLCKQREDAKDLKDNLDRRENLVSTFLSRQLSAEQLQDYQRFVQTKASLLIRQKDLEEKQRLGEEQLEALSNSLSL